MNSLDAYRLKKNIKKINIVDDISISVKSGEVVGLLGPNGAGKTTTFYMICGLVEATSGDVFLNDENISNLPIHRRSMKGVGYLPQEASIFKDLTIDDNLMIAAEVNLRDIRDRENRVEKLLELFNIEPIRNRMGINLSGGERRRVERARALINEPKFLLLDEPFAGVDPIAVNDIQSIIKKLSKMGIGILITDHNVREMLNICDKSYVIKAGRILASGDSEEIKNNELVRKYYLGENFIV